MNQGKAKSFALPTRQAKEVRLDVYPTHVTPGIGMGQAISPAVDDREFKLTCQDKGVIDANDEATIATLRVADMDTAPGYGQLDQKIAKQP